MYDPLLEVLAKYLKQAKVLDIGCGEGSFLAQLTQKVTPALTVGFDIAKEGIYQASNHTQFVQAFWCVADLTNLPFADQSFDMLLNIFSPSNYREFDRILAPGGKLLKVIPGEHYLKELRQAFYPNDARKHCKPILIRHLKKCSILLIFRKRCDYLYWRCRLWNGK